MFITLSPMRGDTPLCLERHGDTLILNDKKLDLSGIPDGATLPRSAVACQWLAGDIDRIDGILHLTLILPHGANAPTAALFPARLVLEADGPVDLPSYGDMPLIEMEASDD
jgi:hypothetical protein